MATTDLPLASPDDINPADETVAGSARQVVDASSATVSMSAVNAVNAETVSAAASAIATAKTGSLDATGCAVGPRAGGRQRDHLPVGGADRLGEG